MKNEHIIIILEYLIKLNGKEASIDDISNDINIEKQIISKEDCVQTIIYLHNKDYVKGTYNKTVTEFGLSELEKIKHQIKIENEKNIRAERKAIYDFNISKFQSEHKFLPYIISGLSLIVSAFALFRGCELKQSPIKQEQIIEKTLIEHNYDSLHNSKNDTDSLNTQ